jgi:biotin operon repressor
MRYQRAEVDHEALVAMWDDLSLNKEMIGARLGITAPTVRKRAQELGLPPRPVAYPPRQRSTELDRRVSEMWPTMSGRDIASALDVTTNSVTTAIERMNLPRRPMAQVPGQPELAHYKPRRRA